MLAELAACSATMASWSSRRPTVVYNEGGGVETISTCASSIVPNWPRSLPHFRAKPVCAARRRDRFWADDPASGTTSFLTLADHRPAQRGRRHTHVLRGGGGGENTVLPARPPHRSSTTANVGSGATMRERSPGKARSHGTNSMRARSPKIVWPSSCLPSMRWPAHALPASSRRNGPRRWKRRSKPRGPRSTRRKRR